MKILLCDDHRLVNEGLCRLLSSVRWEVRGVLTAVETVEATEEWAPDIVLLDVNLGDQTTSGFEVLHDLLSSHPDLPIIIFSMHDAYTMQRAALAEGARGFLAKDDDREEMVEAIECVAAGGTWFPNRGPPLPAELTRRRLMVLHGICQGKGLKQIGQDLNISRSAVKLHLAGLHRAAGSHSTRELIRIATMRGWLLLPTAPPRGTSCTSSPTRMDTARSAPPPGRPLHPRASAPPKWSASMGVGSPGAPPAR